MDQRGGSRPIRETAKTLNGAIEGDAALRDVLASVAPEALSELRRIISGERRRGDGEVLQGIRTVLEWGYAKPTQTVNVDGPLQIEITRVTDSVALTDGDRSHTVTTRPVIVHKRDGSSRTLPSPGDDPETVAVERTQPFLLAPKASCESDVPVRVGERDTDTVLVCDGVDQPSGGVSDG